MHTLRDAATALGETYSRVWHAYAYGKLPRPARVGRTFVLTESDLIALRGHFAAKNRERLARHGSDAASEYSQERVHNTPQAA